MMRKLQRNMRHRWLGGVCSGIARFLGADVFIVRMLIRFAFIAFFAPFWWVYLLLWIFLPTQKLYEAEDDDDRARYTRYKRRKKSVYRKQVKVEVKRLDFDDVVESSYGRVSEAVYARVQSIDEAVRALMPKLGFWKTFFDRDLATVKRAALEYFPQAVQHYLSLPRDYAENHRLASGQTPEEKLLADLGTLEQTLNGVLEGLYHNDKMTIPKELKNLSERISTADPQDIDLNRALENFTRRIQGKVSDEVFAKVLSIRASIESVLPQITELSGGMTQEAYNIRQTALEYLPDALDKYLSLPEGFAESHTLGNGKTPKAVLLEQLDLLDRTMKDLVGDVYQEDADALLIHGRFLKEKFADQKFTLPTDSATPERNPYTSTDDDEDRIVFPDLSSVKSDKVKTR